MGIGALYLHIPFCVRRCGYCDFPTRAVGHGCSQVPEYLDVLKTLLGRLGGSAGAGCGDAAAMRGVETLYIGGGTPTLGGAGLPELVACALDICPRVREASCEANPESLDATMCRMLADAGLTRLSVGVQSLRDEELAALGRLHDSRHALEALRGGLDAGLDVSCDLMCAIPRQTPSSWARTVAEAAGTGVGHISCYPLQIEEGTPLARAIEEGREEEPDPDDEADRMIEAASILADRGFERYEVASYARDGKECRHNIAYWTGVEYLGLGPAAASMFRPETFAALSEAIPLAVVDDDRAPAGLARPDDSLMEGSVSPAAFMAAHPKAARMRMRFLGDAEMFAENVRSGGRLPVSVEVLDGVQAAAEDLMLRFRMTRGVTADEVGTLTAGGGLDPRAVARAFAELEGRGLVSTDENGTVRPTRDGWLQGNILYGRLWDLASE